MKEAYYRPGFNGSSHCCCCSFLNCCFCCIFNFIFQIVCALLLIVGIVVFILWLILRPNPVKFYVTDASLTQFDISPTNNVLYNLALSMKVRNPNKCIEIYYDQIEAEASYAGQVFAATDVTGFYQGDKETDFLNMVFNGQNLMVLEKDDLSKFDFETEMESFSIDIKLDLKVRLKSLLFKTLKLSPKIECDLKVPLDSKGKGSGYFETKRCHFDWVH
ncbi:Harpin inducing protein [Heracleum sosnowskyi]|uniref:Harpin inducing protein n=1 Tax=Heracleum sosnowskyi TaxID=360622 RepID=A0AAD8J6T8_9APIA|nr:Harpin inducing protein [Heracleum sosnowskyi]